MEPLISALMVTKNRLALARRAIRCWQAQEYPNKELVVVNDEDDGTAEWIQSLGDDRLRLVRPEGTHLTLGALRNVSLGAAQGEFIAQWDDDDWYHPQRLSAQVKELDKTGADICLLERWTVAWPARNWYGLSHRNGWEGTVVARNKNLPVYQPVGRGEDWYWMQAAQERGLKVIRLDRPELYIYVVHGDNTYGPLHFETLIFGHLTQQFSGAEIVRLQACLQLPLP